MVNFDPHSKPKKSWGGFGTVIIIVLSILFAWFIVRPLGQEVHDILQRVSNAFNH